MLLNVWNACDLFPGLIVIVNFVKKKLKILDVG